MSRSFGGRSLTTRSPIEIVPPVISSSPAIDRSAVDLPHPRRPHQDHELAVGDVQAQVVDGLDATRVRLLHVVQDDLCHGGSVISS
jgi:hypothetical protein